MRGLADTANALPPVNFAMMARAMGIKAWRIRALGELAQIGVAGLFQREGPVLLDVLVDPQTAPPIGERVNNLAAHGDH